MELAPRQQEVDRALIRALEFWDAQGFTTDEMHDAMSRHTAITDKSNAELQEFAYANSTPYYTGSDVSFLPMYALRLEPDSKLPDQGAIKAFIRGAKAWLIS